MFWFGLFRAIWLQFVCLVWGHAWLAGDHWWVNSPGADEPYRSRTYRYRQCLRCKVREAL